MPRTAPDDIDRAVGIRIAALRKARGLSLQALGAAIGVSFQQVQKYEKGQNRISTPRLRKIAEHLQVSVQDLKQADSTSTRRIDEVVGYLAGEMIAAFVKIENPEARRFVVGFVQSLAKTEMAKSSPAQGD